MTLIDEELRIHLPPLHRRETDIDPVVFARFFIPGTNLAWYPIEGEPDGDDFMFFGFITGVDGFGFFRLSELEAQRSLLGQTVVRDLTFTEGRLTDVVPAPDS